MKTQFFVIQSFLFVTSGFFYHNLYAQKDIRPEKGPDSRFDVQRKYDEEGNLIYYDSVAVSTWGFDSVETDSLNDFWEYGKPNRTKPFYYGFHFPGDGFGMIPQFDFDFVIPDLHDFDEGFEYGFSFIPRDSLNSPVFPDDTLDYYHHVVPPFDFDMDIEEQFYRIQQHMQELHEKMMHEFYSPDPYDPYLPPSDSIDSPPENPKPSPNNYEKNTLYI